MTRNRMKLVHAYRTIAVISLLFSFSQAANWDIQLIESNAGTSSNSDIDMVLDINGLAHVIYFDERIHESLSLIYATNDRGQWSNFPVEQENLNQADLKAVVTVDSNGIVYIIYTDDEYRLAYKTKENGLWSSSAVYAQGAKYLSHDADIDSAGSLNVLYTKKLYDANASDTALILRRLGGADEVIAEHGNFQSGSLAIGSNPHVCYYDVLNEDLMYAVNDGNSWTVEIVDDSIGGVPSSIWDSASLDLDSGGLPHITYIDFTNFDLKYANRLSGGWTTQTIVGGASNVGLQTSIDVDSVDRIHICYKTFLEGRVSIKYAVGSAVEGWQIDCTIADFNQFNNAYPSIACSDSGNPCICYSAPVLKTISYASGYFYGDINGNSRVDFFDFSILAGHWLDTGCGSDAYCVGADIDRDTVVDNNDLKLFTESWLNCSLPDCY